MNSTFHPVDFVQFYVFGLKNELEHQTIRWTDSINIRTAKQIKSDNQTDRAVSLWCFVWDEGAGIEDKVNPNNTGWLREKQEHQPARLASVSMPNETVSALVIMTIPLVFPNQESALIRIHIKMQASKGKPVQACSRAISQSESRERRRLHKPNQTEDVMNDSTFFLAH